MDTSTDTTSVTPFSGDVLNILSKVPTLPLYHYTTQRGLLGIIKDRQIWATHHRHLNDLQEFVYAKRMFCGELQRRAQTDPSDTFLKRMQGALEGEGFENVNLYIASFSEDPDSLPQWRGYGGPAAGFSLGFRASEMALPRSFKMVKCVYIEDEQRTMIEALVTEILDRLRRIPGVAEGVDLGPYAWGFCQIGLQTYAPVLKHPKFKEEREWRIISEVMMDDPPNQKGESPLDFREGRSGLVPYRPVPLRDSTNQFPLAEIVVGPNPDPERSCRAVRSLLTKRGLTNCSVRTSDVPYRNW